MGKNTIHIHRNRILTDSNILLLLIPAIIYILTLGVFFYSTHHGQNAQIASRTESSVLGDEVSLDKPN